MRFERIAILGPGLLGASLAMACGERAVLWGRKPERVAEARAFGLAATADLAEAVRGADLVVMAVPVGVMAGLVERMLPELAAGVVVTDVGSVKACPHETLGGMLSAAGVDFVGSHPMAGSERKGLDAARADLFAGAACVLTNDEGATAETLARLRAFWEELGCRVSEMTAAAHDAAVARISHFPHAMAVLTAEVGLKEGLELAELAGGGFRDTSRVASGDPAMWAEIMMENRASLRGILEEARDSLTDMLELLADSDEEGLRRYLAEVKERRDAAINF
ncbi:MAG: prephenate dehydrogenase [Verrucomicrobiales bacterium]